MLRTTVLLLCAACASAARPVPPASPPAAAPAPDPLVAAYAATAARILDAARADDGAYRKLAYLTDHIGHRLAGSEALDRAVAWGAETLRADGHENVHTEKVMVPRWVRGAESGEILAPVRAPLTLLALGGSSGTPAGGLTAELVVLHDFDEMARRAAELRGKIVLFDVAMAATIPPGPAYGAAVRYRGRGPARAAKLGAIAVLVRSVTAHSLHTPHTGSTVFHEDEAPIPCAAVTAEDSALLARLSAAGPVRINLRLGARTLPDAPSANVVGELVGRERPDEVVVIGGHLDSWDVGQGAHDDGAGCVGVMHALTLLRRLGLVPRRTIRVVLYTNEENGVRGGKAYAEQHAADVAKHVAAIETDSGGFRPRGFQVETGPAVSLPATALAARLAPLFAPVGADHIVAGHGGTDIGPLGRAGVPLLGLEVDGATYFDIHHTPADTLDKVKPDELALDAGVLAVMAYVLADMPETLPRDAVPPPPPSE